jgi:hypothetical protein
MSLLSQAPAAPDSRTGLLRNIDQVTPSVDRAGETQNVDPYSEVPEVNHIVYLPLGLS